MSNGGSTKYSADTNNSQVSWQHIQDEARRNDLSFVFVFVFGFVSKNLKFILKKYPREDEAVGECVLHFRILDLGSKPIENGSHNV